MDDSSFPIGAANHKVSEEFKKSYSGCPQIDVVVLNAHAEIDSKNLAGFRVMMDQERLNDEIVTISMSKTMLLAQTNFFRNSKDVTELTEENKLRINLDAKKYFICSIFSKMRSRKNGRKPFKPDERGKLQKFCLKRYISHIISNTKNTLGYLR